MILLFLGVLIALAPALAKHPSLFHNLSKACEPIAIKSTRFNNNDQMLIDKEIDGLYSEGIIKSSMSLRRVQIVVVKDANSNKRRCALITVKL